MPGNTGAGIGGAERDRTVDLLIANEALSQLSYSPTGPEEARIIGVERDLSSFPLGVATAASRRKKRRSANMLPRCVAVVYGQPRSFSEAPRPAETRPMVAIARLIDTVVTLYIWVLIAQAILSWLIAFNVVNGYNTVVRGLGEFLWRVTEPVLRPLRRFVPAIGGVDISPIVLILVLYFLRDLVLYDLVPALQ